MVYFDNGTQVTDVREVAVSQTWETGSDWNDYQSRENLTVESGSIVLDQFSLDENLYAHFDASALNETDGNTISTWPDESGNGNDLSGGSPTYRASQINSNPAIEFTGSESMSVSFSTSQSMPITVYIVYQSTTSSTSLTLNLLDSTTGTTATGLLSSPHSGSGDVFAAFNGSNYLTTGDAHDQNPHIGGVIFNGTDVVSVDGSETTGNAGDRGPADGITVANQGGDSGNGFQGYISEIRWYNTGHGEGTRSNIYNHLSDKWGISI